MTNNYRQQITRLFQNANNHIQVAVSWFTDEYLLDQLVAIASSKKVDILLSADHVNLVRHTQIKKLKDAGAIIRKAGSETAIDGNFMHCKMVIIDNNEVFGGSYNFTENARTNMENFNKYTAEGLCELRKHYNYWFDNSIDFFHGIDDAESVVKRIKERFLLEEKRRESFLNILGKELSEREEIIKLEIRKDTLRKTVNCISEGTNSISSHGQVIESHSRIISKPHKFYGGSVLTGFGGHKKKNSYAAALLQKKELESKFSFLKCTIKNDTLISNGHIHPEGCSRYNIRIEFRAGTFPQVYIMKPKIVANGVIHIYKEGSLCLFYPGDLKWKDSTSIAEYTIPWIYEWILYYEIYLLTNKWEGLSEPHSIRLSNHLS